MSDGTVSRDDLVTLAHIARRLHLSRAGALSAARSPGFPAPLGHLNRSAVWRWADVRTWAEGAAGSPVGPTEEGLRLAGIRDRFRAAGFRLKIEPDRETGGWRAIRVSPGRRSTAGQVFVGDDPIQAAESALRWLETHH